MENIEYAGSISSEQPLNFGQVRQMIIQTIVDLRAQRIDATRGLAIAANLKCLNDNVQVEINAAKLAVLTEGRAFNFGKVVTMGQKLIGDSSSEGGS